MNCSVSDAPESRLGIAYRTLYELLCGRHPNLRPWHFQWLPAHFLNRSMARWLSGLGGTVLDLGCGQKPYQPLFGPLVACIGVDHTPLTRADVVAAVDRRLPFQDGAFDAVLMAQVMEYLADPGRAIAEIWRVLRPGGVAVISFPFLFNEHGPHDYLRLSGRAVETLFADFGIRCLERQGGIGSTLAILLLNWLHVSLNRTFLLRLARPFLLPVWLPFCAVVNLAALVLDRLDVTNVFYSNVFVVLEKPGGKAVPEGAPAS